jgi:Na+-transporting NADH:ubiquinone oxidoreductase subunit F
VCILLLVEATVVRKEDCSIMINDDPGKSITVSTGSTLLSALVNKKIYLPSACGGSGSCGQCRCQVLDGGGEILPTEIPHLSRREKKDQVRLACQLKIREDLTIRVPAEIFSIKLYHATVVSNENVATFIKEIIFKLDNNETLTFTAGAYIQIDIPEYHGLSYSQFNVADRFRACWEKFDLFSLKAESEEPVYRAYSLANPPSENKLLRLTVRIATPPEEVPEALPGIGSSYIFSLKPGDQVTLSGPYGDFFVKDTDREMCFVGGGAGMAPMRCHILHQLDTVKTKRKTTYWYGARSKSEMFYEDEFRRLEKENDNFSFHIALSKPEPEDHWEGMVGNIHQCLHDNYLNTHEDPSEIEYYLCGPPLMIAAMKKMLDDLGVAKEMIMYDEFG